MNALALAWIAPSGVLGANSATAMDEAVVPDDAGLVTEARAGRDDAFAELVRRHKQRVFAAASRYARDDHQVDDIAQEIFVRAYRNLGQFRGDAPFEHWLSKIIVAAVREFPDETAECAIAAGRAREFLAWGMRKLSAADQLILTLCELEERPVREVARLTDWSESNVKVRAFRARQNLKKILETSHER
jgi:RNA polymerase sigma-70 factor (ECF subfamily)